MDNKIYQNVDQTAKCWYIDKKTTSKKEKKKTVQEKFISIYWILFIKS